MTTHDTKVRSVAALIFDGLAPLDLFGPLQAFNLARVESAENNDHPYRYLYDPIFTLGHTQGMVKIGHNHSIAIQADYAFADIPQLQYDILLIPGGFSTRRLVRNEDFIRGVRAACEKADIVASVCTGAGLLARTGLLDEKTATSNKKAWDWVVQQGTKVNWDCPKRWINLIDPDTKKGIITSAGVSAGTDMAIALIENLNGREVRKELLENIEYDWTNKPCEDNFAYLCPEC